MRAAWTRGGTGSAADLPGQAKNPIFDDAVKVK